MEFMNRYWWKVVIILLFIAVLAMCVGCDSAPTVKNETVGPPVTLPDPLQYAVVTWAPNLQFMYSEQCPIKIQARFPDKNNGYPSETIFAACSLRLTRCARVTTGYPEFLNDDGKRIRSAQRFVLEVDLHPAPADFVCDPDGSGKISDSPMSRTVVSSEEPVEALRALAYLSAVAAGQPFDDQLLTRYLTIVEEATKIRSRGVTFGPGGACSIDNILLKQDLDKWRSVLIP